MPPSDCAKVIVAPPLPSPSPRAISWSSIVALAYPISLKVSSEVPAPGAAVAKTAWKVWLPVIAGALATLLNTSALVGLVCVLHPINASAQHPIASLAGAGSGSTSGVVALAVVVAKGLSLSPPTTHVIVYSIASHFGYRVASFAIHPPLALV